jgi:hypothetical protein
MQRITITYEDPHGDEKEEVVDAFERLVERVRSITQANSTVVGMPFGLDLVAENGKRLSVAFGDDCAVVSHYDAQERNTVTAVGSPTVAGSTAFYFGDHTLMPNKFQIPNETAWEVVKEWCEYGTLCSKVDWTSRIR